MSAKRFLKILWIFIVSLIFENFFIGEYDNEHSFSSHEKYLGAISAGAEVD